MLLKIKCLPLHPYDMGSIGAYSKAKVEKITQMKSVRPKKFLGQHFLTHLPTAQAIADTVDACPDIPILEVGPGMGVMTQFLLKKQREFKVVEIDFESVAYLKENYPELREGIIEADFLKMSLDETFGGRPFVLTGNYPYNISSQIFFKMLEYRHLIPCCTGMIQKEVAERLAAQPGCKAYGILSVLVQLYYHVDYLFTVEPGVFNPPPKVRSAVIRMTRNDVTDIGCDEVLLRRLVKTTFNQRRKMMRGSIKPLLHDLDQRPGTIAPDHTAFLAQPVFTRRPEQLSVQEFIDLTNMLSKHYEGAITSKDGEETEKA